MATLVREGSLVSGECLASPVHSGLCACWCRLFHRREPVDFGVPTRVLQPWRLHPASRNPGSLSAGVVLPCPTIASVNIRPVCHFRLFGLFLTRAPQQLSTSPSEIKNVEKQKWKKNCPPWPWARDSSGTQVAFGVCSGNWTKQKWLLRQSTLLRKGRIQAVLKGPQ